MELLEHLGEGRWRVRLDGEPDGRGAAAAVHHRAARRSRALPDRLRGRGRLGRGADRRAPLHAGAARAGSTSSASRSTSGSTPSARSRPTTLEEHELHGERYAVRPEAWERIRRRRTSARRRDDDGARARDARARRAARRAAPTLFVTPGFEFRRVDALLTNFHLPRSTLLALVMAFAGVEETRRLYRLAIEERYRFYSFGDAMLIL